MRLKPTSLFMIVGIVLIVLINYSYNKGTQQP